MTRSLARISLLVFLAASGAVQAEQELPEPVAPELPPDPFALFSARRSWDPILDAARPCLPEEVPEVLASVMPFALAGDESAVRRVLDLLEPDLDEDALTPEIDLWIQVLRARTADTGERRRDVVRQLDRALDRGGQGRARACAYLERARVALESGMAPEASASAVLALRSVGLDAAGPVREGAGDDAGEPVREGAGDDAAEPVREGAGDDAAEPVREGAGDDAADPIRESASFLRAEALRLSGRWEAAEPLYQSFRTSADSRIRAAAELRFADREAADQAPAVAWAALREKIVAAQGAGLSLDGFERGIAEHALRAGDTRRALLWITHAADLRGDERTTGLATVRKADLLSARGRGDDALLVLERLAEVHHDPDIRTLARVRIVALGLGEATEADRRTILEESTRAAEPGLALHARSLLLHRAVKAGQVDEALSHYARLAYTDPALRFAPDWRDDLDAALEQAVDPYCPTTVRRLGGRRELLMREARVAEPFIALADCLLALDMPRPALDTYRAVSRGFGAEMAPRLTLRMARASLGVGDLASVGAAIRAHRAARADGSPAPGGLAGDSWELFEAELALLEDRKEAAAELLQPLVLEEDTPIRAVRWFAELARDGAAPAEAAIFLQELSARWQIEGRHEDDAEERALVSLALADLLRGQGDLAGAHYAYGQAVDGLPDGPERERARFLLADLSARGDKSRLAFEAAVEEGLWGRLAAIELRSRDLREQVALDEPGVDPVDRAPGSGVLP